MVVQLKLEQTSDSAKLFYFYVGQKLTHVTDEDDFVDVSYHSVSLLLKNL